MTAGPESLFSATYDAAYFSDGALAATSAVAGIHHASGVAAQAADAVAIAYDATKAAAGHAQNLRLFVHRHDWLICEQLTALSLLAVRWADTFSGQSSPDSRPSAFEYPAAAHREVSVVADRVERMRQRFPALDYRFADPIRQLVAEPERVSLAPQDTPEHRHSARSRLAGALARLPGFLGVAAFGSTAQSEKEDAYSDVDLLCVCESLPTDAQRNAFDASLGISGTYRNGRAHYLCLDGVYFHLNFILKDEQYRAFDTRDRDGLEPAITDFGRTIPRCATWSYDWMCALILHDPQHVVAEIMRRAAVFPEALREREQKRWQAQHVLASNGALAALERSDHLSAFALSTSALEAAARHVLASARTFSNPVAPKWFMLDMKLLGGDRPQVKECLALLQNAIRQDIATRLATAEKMMALS